jgi:hypothetical protein
MAIGNGYGLGMTYVNGFTKVLNNATIHYLIKCVIKLTQISTCHT